MAPDLSPTCRRCGAADWWWYTRGGRPVRACRQCRKRSASRRRARKPAEVLYHNALGRARRNGTPFTITLVDVTAALGAWECAYCAKELRPAVGGGRGASHDSLTIDRVVPVLGYTPANIVVACHTCNCEKQDFTPRRLRWLADRIDEIIRARGLTRLEGPETA